MLHDISVHYPVDFTLSKPDWKEIFNKVSEELCVMLIALLLNEIYT